MTRLENWAIVLNTYDPYAPPETQIVVLRGEVYGHPKYADGTLLITTPIKDVVGNTVRTCNTTYILGIPQPEYVEWCKQHNTHVPTVEEPIKVKAPV